MNLLRNMHIFFLFYATFGISRGKKDVETQVLSFCRNNGQKYGTIVDLEKTRKNNFMKTAFDYDISIRIFSHLKIRLSDIDCLIVNCPVQGYKYLVSNYGSIRSHIICVLYHKQWSFQHSNVKTIFIIKTNLCTGSYSKYRF